MSNNATDPLATLALAVKNGEQIYYYDDDRRIPVILSNNNQSEKVESETDSDEDSETECLIELVPDEVLTHWEHPTNWTIKTDFIQTCFGWIFEEKSQE